MSLIGSGPASRDAAMHHPERSSCFLCWQACLIGSPKKFDTETEAVHPNLLMELHTLYLNEADCRFAYSPTLLK